ncbi:MAG: hypothetical protein O9325_07810, partial [Roseomonas sp.]|nr:hypothetical protein [Roseomonas sp.]
PRCDLGHREFRPVVAEGHQHRESLGDGLNQILRVLDATPRSVHRRAPLSLIGLRSVVRFMMSCYPSADRAVKRIATGTGRRRMTPETAAGHAIVTSASSGIGAAIATQPLRESFPSNLTDAQWARLEPLIPPAKPGGRPRKTNMRAALDALF